MQMDFAYGNTEIWYMANIRVIWNTCQNEMVHFYHINVAPKKIIDIKNSKEYTIKFYQAHDSNSFAMKIAEWNTEIFGYNGTYVHRRTHSIFVFCDDYFFLFFL